MNLSIVIPSHNRTDLLRLCLETVVEFAPERTQVIVVDDGSPEACVSRTAAKFAGVEIVRNPRPLGFAKAANRGIASATGDVIELLNDDTQVTANWAQAALKWFTDPTIAAVAPLVLQGPSSDTVPIIDSAGDDYDLGGFATKRGHGKRRSAAFAEPREVFGASASSAFYRADVLRSVGCFPEEFGAYFEDVDLAWRIRNAGFRAMYEPASVVWHRIGSSYRKSRALIERQSQNEERVFWRNVPNIWPLLPRHAAVLAAKAVRRIREGTIVPWTIGRLRAWSKR
ncbi:MAG: glycosyltransferase family 2 protein [Gemmataceae bacterium]|nr:glycosyltransferase family 2 protein [Gemmataceae bacterium]